MACQLPSLYMVVCAGTINFVVVPNANRIGPIESGVFKMPLCDGLLELQLSNPSMLLASVPFSRIMIEAALDLCCWELQLDCLQQAKFKLNFDKK